jgi:hypothetical protein
MNGAYNEMKFVGVWASKRPYMILGFVATMVSYGV